MLPDTKRVTSKVLVVGRVLLRLGLYEDDEAWIIYLDNTPKFEDDFEPHTDLHLSRHRTYEEGIVAFGKVCEQFAAYPTAEK